jgi:hypothetical protein
MSKQKSGTGDPEAVLAAAARQRRRGLRTTRRSAQEDMMSDLLAEEPAKRKPRKPPVKPVAAIPVAAGPRAAAIDAGLVTRGVRAGLDGLRVANETGRMLGLWGIGAVSALVMLFAFTFTASFRTPQPPRVSDIRINYLPGPELPKADIIALLRKFPQQKNLSDPDDNDLELLAEFLRQQSAVAEVSQVCMRPLAADGEHPLRRVIDLDIRLREPEMPVVLASGERAWVDAGGHILPGVLPGGQAAARPVLREIESGGPGMVEEALKLWRNLEPLIEPGLVTNIRLNDVLDLKDQRGLVLYTRQGSRLIWGRPVDELYGVTAADKVRDLVHTIRCQGDLDRVAVINVRFRQPFFTLREQK